MLQYRPTELHVEFHWLTPPFWFQGLQIMTCHGVSLRKSMGIYIFPVLRIFDICGNSQERNSAHNKWLVADNSDIHYTSLHFL
jgi:hypothetical protein